MRGGPGGGDAARAASDRRNPSKGPSGCQATGFGRRAHFRATLVGWAAPRSPSTCSTSRAWRRRPSGRRSSRASTIAGRSSPGTAARCSPSSSRSTARSRCPPRSARRSRASSASSCGASSRPGRSALQLADRLVDARGQDGGDQPGARRGAPLLRHARLPRARSATVPTLDGPRVARRARSRRSRPTISRRSSSACSSWSRRLALTIFQRVRETRVEPVLAELLPLLREGRGAPRRPRRPAAAAAHPRALQA